MSVGRPPRAAAPLDVDRLLQARYLAEVVEQLQATRVPVDAAVLNGPGRPGGTVVLGDQGATTDPLLPSCARWNGGRCWTLVFPGAGGGVRRHRLRKQRLPTPREVARFVARFAAQPATGRRRVLRWHPVPAGHPARGH